MEHPLHSEFKIPHSSWNPQMSAIYYLPETDGERDYSEQISQTRIREIEVEIGNPISMDTDILS